jgi:hypothetical protein
MRTSQESFGNLHSEEQIVLYSFSSLGGMELWGLLDYPFSTGELFGAHLSLRGNK